MSSVPADTSRQESNSSSNIQLTASKKESDEGSLVSPLVRPPRRSETTQETSDHDIVQRTQPPTAISDHQLQAGTGRLSVLSPSHDIRTNLTSRFEIGESSHQVPRIISQPRYQQVEEIDLLPATHVSSSGVLQILQTTDENEKIGSTNESSSTSLPPPIPSMPPSTQPPDVVVLQLPNNRVQLGMNTHIMPPSSPTLSSSPTQPSSLAAPTDQPPRPVPSSIPLPTPPPSIPRSVPGNSYIISINEACTVCERDIGDRVGSEGVTELPCSHRFHNNCIEMWSRNHDTCPACGFRLLPNVRGHQRDGGRCCGLS